MTGYSIQDEASDVQITDLVPELHRKNETFPRISHLEQFTPRILLIQFSQLPGLPVRGDQGALVQGPCLGDLGDAMAQRHKGGRVPIRITPCSFLQNNPGRLNR
ncbi:MAG: hypothetical protein QF614_03955, partial [SAR324 cluster bacterium]|nr:hypothetical protein [SAR324 cluster bacterium]